MRRFKQVRKQEKSTQRGVSMIFALLALIVLTLATAALVRSVSGGMVALGNLGFKQDATRAATGGAEAAIQYLTNNVSTAILNTNNNANGYYATAFANLDVSGAQARMGAPGATFAVPDWDADGCAGYSVGVVAPCLPVVTVPTTSPFFNANNRTSYIITRLCPGTGSPGAANPCMQPRTSGTGEARERGNLTSASNLRVTVAMTGTYFRVITRVQGTRNTVSFTETLVHF